MRSVAIGVDLGGTNMRVAAVGEDGALLETIHSSTELQRGPALMIGEMCRAIRVLAGKFTRTRTLLGIGVGVPGIIEFESGTVRAAANLPGWSDYPVKKELEAQLGVPVLLENDANCAALGEKWIGAGRGVEDLCMLTLGTGVGGGFVVNGRPWHGMLGMAGELGHMTVIPDGAPCACGNRGCLEQYASATAIKRMALDAIGKGQSPAMARAAELDPHFSARSVFECAQQGDPAAQAIFGTMGAALGIALSNLINALNLPLYVVGGGVANAWPVFSPAMLRELHKRSIVFRAGGLQSSPRTAMMVTPTLLEENAGLLGAARLPMLREDPPQCCPLAG